MIWKRIVASALAMCLTLGVVPISHNCFFQQSTAYATEAQRGTCGENLTWVYDGKGTLIISGTGAMSGWEDSRRGRPWNDFEMDITTVIIEDGVTTIGNSAFEFCSGITTVTIPDSVTSIEDYAFSYCIRLKELTISEHVTEIGYLAFERCAALTAFDVAKNNPKFMSDNGVLFDKDQTELLRYPCSKEDTSYTIPDSVTVISEAAFEFCKNLSNIKIPSGVLNIGEFTFFASNFTSIEIPDTVEKIGYKAFGYCNYLKSIVFPESVSMIEESAFEYCIGLESITIKNPECIIYDSKNTFSNDANTGKFSGVIYGYIDSTAQAYAQKYNRVFVEFNENLDSTFDSVYYKEITDKLDKLSVLRDNVIATQYFLLNKKYYGTGKVVDFNNDNIVDVFDLALIKREYYLLVMELSLAIDSDNNGYPDCLEYDDHTTDTDGDGICDYDELMYTNTSPLLPDTDNNGILDADEDYDADSLSNIEELRLGTNPLLADSDSDGLTDEQEIFIGTNPMEPDTDGDGANDGWEISNGYNPLIYNDTFEVTVVTEKNEIVASATINGKGATSASLQIEAVEDNVLLSDSMPGYIGSAFNFSTGESFESATISFSFDDSLLLNSDFNPTIYYYNEKTQMLEELETTVLGNTAYANVSHFSTYVLLDKTVFDKVWEEEIRMPDETMINSGISVFFVLDRSGSMDDNDSEGLRYTVTKEFIASMNSEKDFIGIISYNDNVTIESELSNDFDFLCSKIENISSNNGGTDGSKGIKEALNQFASDKSGNAKYIVFMTDGEDTSTSYDYNELIDTAISNGIVIYTIGLGEVNDYVLNELASNTKGRYLSTSMVDELIDVFEQAKKETIDYHTDSNNDGISDYYTKLISEGKLRTGTGITIADGYTYGELQASDDWDRDGLKNSEEITVVLTAGIVSAYLISGPTLIDTDLDGIPDIRDTAPLNKGLDGGVCGELTIVACKPDKINDLGHAWLTYKSYINDEIDISGFLGGYVYSDSGNGFLYAMDNQTYSIYSGGYLGIGGAGTEGQSAALLNVGYTSSGGILYNRVPRKLNSGFKINDTADQI